MYHQIKNKDLKLFFFSVRFVCMSLTPQVSAIVPNRFGIKSRKNQKKLSFLSKSSFHKAMFAPVVCPRYFQQFSDKSSRYLSCPSLHRVLRPTCEWISPYGCWERSCRNHSALIKKRNTHCTLSKRWIASIDQTKQRRTFKFVAWKKIIVPVFCY